jgi:hypothetical protein
LRGVVQQLLNDTVREFHATGELGHRLASLEVHDFSNRLRRLR